MLLYLTNLYDNKYRLKNISAIENLKHQISTLMKGESSTRQAQIEELRKKLIDAAREANQLK